MSKEVAEIYVLKSLFGMTRQVTESRTSFMGKRGSLYVVVVNKKKNACTAILKVCGLISYCKCFTRNFFSLYYCSFTCSISIEI